MIRTRREFIHVSMGRVVEVAMIEGSALLKSLYA